MTNLPIAYAAPARDTDSRKVYLEASIEACRKMHEAQFEYETFDDRWSLDQINNPAPPTPFEYLKPPASVEYLMHMQKQREALQTQLDRMEVTLDDDALPPMMRPIMEATMLGPLRSQLERYDEEISDIQKRLENPE